MYKRQHTQNVNQFQQHPGAECRPETSRQGICSLVEQGARVSGALRRFLASEDGPTAVEYAVMLAFIITVCITAIASVGTHVNAYFVSAQNALT